MYQPNLTFIALRPVVALPTDTHVVADWFKTEELVLDPHLLDHCLLPAACGGLK